MERAANAFSGRVVAASLCMVFSLLAVLIGLAFGVTALWIYLSNALGPLGAAAGCALILLAISIILAAVAKALFAPEAPDLAGHTAQAASAGADMADDVIKEISHLIGGHKSAALIAAIIAGLMAGRSRK